MEKLNKNNPLVLRVVPYCSHCEKITCVSINLNKKLFRPIRALRSSKELRGDL